MTGASETTAGAFARRYDSVMVPVIFQPWARELIARAAPKDGEDILDLACGTGAVTRELIATGRRFGSLTGADMSNDMLSVARETTGATGIEARFVQALAGELPFPDHSFDVAFCQQALQFFPDRHAALTDLRRVLRPGGRVAFCVTTGLEENPLLQAQAEALEHFAGPEAGRAVRAICGLVGGDRIRTLFDEAGFSNIRVERVGLMLHHPDGRAYAEGAMGGMHTGDKLSSLDRASRNACFELFLDRMGGCFDGKAIRFPHVSNVVTAQR
ncbi:class I SAM-dependent methyltransferase [Mameliella sediminis]|uniref:class I SAM-dependent methyltransferase n=1 Tax=Mameliella sediminis TaxID=2836866 RepID=UPI001C483140|nr:methyltransferase domain-containing protein [Mameliella sediminis]MBV7394238.1 class I SAM-dependent methyltransferase [Mameliella sediminis]